MLHITDQIKNKQVFSPYDMIIGLSYFDLIVCCQCGINT